MGRLRLGGERRRDDHVRGADLNGVSDVMLFTDASRERRLLGERGATSASTDPQTSPHGNYIVFERGGQTYLLYVGAK